MVSLPSPDGLAGSRIVPSRAGLSAGGAARRRAAPGAGGAVCHATSAEPSTGSSYTRRRGRPPPCNHAILGRARRAGDYVAGRQARAWRKAKAVASARLRASILP